MMSTTQTDSVFLQALRGVNKKIPVWFMRQAGRYLPQYQKIKEHCTLNEMFTNPDIIADVTLMPVDILGVDAAILFADILTLPGAMGFDITFENKRGPVIANPISSVDDVRKIHDFTSIGYLEAGIRQITHKLPDSVPLIGFAGAPFTVASYLIEGGVSSSFRKFFSFAYRHENVFCDLMEILTENTIRYLEFQKKHGIQVFQLFDTWGGVVRVEDYERWVLPYIQRIFASVDLPGIYYLRNGHHLLPFMIDSGADVLSVCHAVSLSDDRLLRSGKGVQGNFYNMLLYADYQTIEAELKKTLRLAQRFRKYIFNLNHGVFPDVEVDKLKFIVKKVHEYPWGE